MTALNTDPLTVTLDDAARRLGISRKGVDRLVDSGKLPRRRIEGRVVIPYAALRAYVDNLPEE